MRKFTFYPLVLSLLIIGFLSSCTSTRYGAHFQPGPNQYYAHEKEVQPLAQPEVNKEGSKEKIVPFAKKVNIEVSVLEMPTPVVSLEKVKVAPEVPSVDHLVKNQKELVQKVRERLQSMSREERKELRRQIKKLNLEELAENMKANDESGMMDMQQETNVNVVALVLALLLPPLGVYIHQGEINEKFWISLLLTLLFYVPGQIYSVLVVLGIID